MSCFVQFWPKTYKVSSKIAIVDDKGKTIGENELKEFPSKNGEAEITTDATTTTGSPGDYPFFCKWDITMEYEGKSYTHSVKLNKTVVVYR